MGARGRKRKRSDGRIATGKVSQARAVGTVTFRVSSVAEVDAASLGRALTILNEHLPLDRSAFLAVEDDEERLEAAETAFEAACGDLHHTEQLFALDRRVHELADFLRREENSIFYKVESDGNVDVAEALLAYAATCPMDDDLENVGDKLVWPPA